MCQHLRVHVGGSAAKPIDLYNVHSPSSGKHKLTASLREEICTWFSGNAGNRALIGGDLDSSRLTLATCFGNDADIKYCYEEGHKHGDLVVAMGLPAAFSVACDAQATSREHRMCVVCYMEDDFRLLLTKLREMKQTDAYQNLVKMSKKRTEEATRLKLERNDARLRLRQGKRDADGHRDTPLAKKYKSGELAKTCAAAEAGYRPRKTLGVAHSIGNRLHE